MGTHARHILYVSQYFPPEVNAPAVRVSEFAREWTRDKRRVSVLTGFPNHPGGVIPPEYKGSWYRHERREGYDVHRTWLYATANAGIVKRSMGFLSFMVSAVVTGLTRIRDVDVVIATSPQLLVALAGWVIAFVKRVPFVFEVRDLWPAEIVAVGAIRRPWVIGALERLEMFLYRRAERIVPVARGTIEILTQRGVPRRKLTLIPNGVTTEDFAPSALSENPARARHGLNGEFVVTYIGTVGMAHRLEVLLEAADRLRARADIRFVVVGEGARRAELERQSRSMRLPNVTWVDQQPRHRIAQYYDMSDGCLVHLRRTDLFTKNVPSKTYEIMASGKPILLGTVGEAKRLVRRAGCGVFFEPENGRDLADQVSRLAENRTLGNRLGCAGRRFVRRHYDRRRLARRYLGILDGMWQSPDAAAHDAQRSAASRYPSREAAPC